MPVVIVYNHLPQVIAAVIANEDDLSKDVATTMKNAAEFFSPVRTGALRNGIQLEGEGSRTVYVTASSIEGGATREYARYVEYGTRFTPAQPFMMPGFVSGLIALPRHARAYGAKIEAAA